MLIPEDATPRERELYAVIAELRARIAELEAGLAKARKGSSNSSGPPAVRAHFAREQAPSLLPMPP